MNAPAFRWRSLLYVPANAARFVEKAHQRGADAVILDLEDSVAPADKAAARAALAAAVPQVAQGGADVLVRINQPLRLAVLDVEAAVLPGVAALVVTKVEGASHLRLLDDLVCALELERGLALRALRFVVVVETPQAWLRMPEIFAASSRNVAAVLGSEDFSLACHAEPTDEALLLPKQQLVIAARAQGLMPLGLIATVADYADTERLQTMALRSRRIGFAGATCIHPNQVQAVNAAFAPTAAELHHARAVVEAYAEAMQAGRGAVSLHGQMVDAPVVARARRLLDSA